MQHPRLDNKMVEPRGVRPNSRQRLKELKREEEYLSETFKIDNFYNNDMLDLATLKNKIGEIKRKADNPEELLNKSRQKNNPGLTLIPFSNKIQRLYHPKIPRPKITSSRISGRETATGTQQPRNPSAMSSRIGNRNTININISNLEEQYRKDLKTPRAGKHRVEDAGGLRYQSIDNQDHRKSRDLEDEDLYGNFRSTVVPKIQAIGRRQNLTNIGGKSQKSESLRKILNSSRLEPLIVAKKSLTLLQVQSQQQLLEFESNVSTIWSIYDRLTEVIKTLSYQSSSVLTNNCNKMVSQEFIKTLCQYKEMVCSSRLEFIVGILDNCLQFTHAKTIILSRLLQNLSIVYVFLEIVQQATQNRDKFYSSHLVNFVGIASHNLLLLIRLITLVSVVNQSLQVSQSAMNIFATITEFEINSYRSQLVSVKETVIRMEHNNELLGIIQGKLNSKMITKDYHKECFGKFMKGVVVDRLKEEIQVAGDRNANEKKGFSQTKPFFQYSYFIFEYLAFHLHHEEYLGFFPKDIETVPEPYLPLKKQFTIIMDPTKILVHQGKQKIFIRAHTEIFLHELLQKANLVFWTDKMPNQIDSLLNLLHMSPKENPQHNKNENEIKHLYKHHCYYSYNCYGQLSLVKDIARVGCLPGKYIILDGDLANYMAGDEAKCILLPWKGEAKDSRLATVLDFLLPFLREGTDLSKGLVLLKPRLEELLRPKKRKSKNQQFF